MENKLVCFEVLSLDRTVTEGRITDRILLCNEKTRQYGLTLTGHQAAALARTRSAALLESRRIEFGCGIIDRLILAFCDSPYITQENFEDCLHELIRLFYDLKNDTWDRVPDTDLIAFLKTAFDGCCQGSVELLAEKAVQLAAHIHGGGKMDTLRLQED